jgi:hypothetical protein
VHNPTHLPDPVLRQGSKMDIELGYLGCVNLALEICTVTYYKNFIVKSLTRAGLIKLSTLGSEAKRKRERMVPITTAKKGK